MSAKCRLSMLDLYCSNTYSMASINFILQSSINPATIYLRFTHGRNIDIKAKTKYVINPTEWNKKKQQPKNIVEANNAKLIKELSNLKNELLNSYNDIKDNSLINSKWLKDFLNPPTKEFHAPNELVAYFNFYIKVKKKEISNSTIKKYNVIKHLLERFEIDKNYTFLISDVNNSFKNSFIDYCNKESYADGTIKRNLKFIKTICLHAKQNHIKVDEQLKDFKYNKKIEKLKPITLSFNELEQIEKTEFSERLENVKDWLIISCYTGQRVSDFMKFDSSMISYTNEKPNIEFVQQKTNKQMVVALHPKVMSILKKRNKEFPKKISDQKYNKYIKEVCEISGITEKIEGRLKKVIKSKSKKYRSIQDFYEKYKLVGSHIGRRSFATNYYGIIPTPTLMSATGHTTERSFLVYIGKSDIENANQLHQYF